MNDNKPPAPDAGRSGPVASIGPKPDVGKSRGSQDDSNDFVRQRLHSLDVYRGIIMISLAFSGFGLAETARNYLSEQGTTEFWSGVLYQFQHVQWVGCTYWDMIQPSFMFMVGVSMAYSYAKRQREGDSWWRMGRHALWRGLALTLFGVFLSSNWSGSTNWTFTNVLSQIGLGYGLLFLLWNRGFFIQTGAVAAIFFVSWTFFTVYPDAGIDLESGAPDVGVSAEWAQENLQGVGKAWHKNANVAHAFDLSFLNLFPRKEAFEFNQGGYQTLNFVPSLITMIIGLMCGELIRSHHSKGGKFFLLLLMGGVGVGLGWVLDDAGFCPLVKRIWTPVWALYSAGWCCLILALLYGVIDGIGIRFWTYPFIVVGMNSFAMYFMAMLLKPWVRKTLETHFGDGVFGFMGPLNQPFVQATVTGLVLWLICWWMYRQRIFVRI